MATREYVELHCHSYFSLLDGASSPEALVERAVALGYPALALTDHDGLYGAVRFWQAAKEQARPPGSQGHHRRRGYAGQYLPRIVPRYL